MAEFQAEFETDRPRTRWPFLLAGLSALGVATARTILGGRNDLPNMVGGLDRPEFAALIYINWYALSIAFATLGLALLFATRLPSAAARPIAAIAAIVFAATCALFMYFVHQATGSPFTYFPWFPLAATALLSALAAWRG